MKNVNANTANNILPLMANAYSKKFGIEVKMQGSIAYTNGKSITVTYLEIKDMQKHLQTLYTGGIQMSFAEKIACRNKEY